VAICPPSLQALFVLTAPTPAHLVHMSIFFFFVFFSLIFVLSLVCLSFSVLCLFFFVARRDVAHLGRSCVHTRARAQVRNRAGRNERDLWILFHATSIPVVVFLFCGGVGDAEL